MWVRLVSRKTTIPFRTGSCLSSNVVVCGHCLCDCPAQLLEHYNGSHRCPSSFIQESFWWWQCSVRYSLPLPPPPGISVPACTSLDVKPASATDRLVFSFQGVYVQSIAKKRVGKNWMNRDGRNLEDFLAAGKAYKLYTELHSGGGPFYYFRCGFSADGTLSK